MSTPARRTWTQPSRARAAAIGFGWFAPPVAWALHLGIGYASAGWACAHDARWTLYALTLVALALALGGVFVSRRNAQRPPAAATVRFLGRSGYLLGLLFVVVILAQTLPIMLQGCP